MTEKILDIYKTYKLTRDELYRHPKKDFYVITRAGVRKILATLDEHELGVILEKKEGTDVVVRCELIWHIGDKMYRHQSLGEASEQNNKFKYPVAVAQKRAESRCILEAVRIHGLIYGEDEVDRGVAESELTSERAQQADNAISDTEKALRLSLAYENEKKNKAKT